jgi:hypothetical protein
MSERIIIFVVALIALFLLLTMDYQIAHSLVMH